MSCAIALLVGWLLPKFPGAEAGGPGFLLAVGAAALLFGVLALVGPWLTGVFLDYELTPLYAGILTLIVGTSWGISGIWLAASPFSRLAWYSVVTMGFLVAFFLFTALRWAFLRSMKSGGRSRP